MQYLVETFYPADSLPKRRGLTIAPDRGYNVVYPPPVGVG